MKSLQESLFDNDLVEKDPLPKYLHGLVQEIEYVTFRNPNRYDKNAFDFKKLSEDADKLYKKFGWFADKDNHAYESWFKPVRHTIPNIDTVSIPTLYITYVFLCTTETSSVMTGNKLDDKKIDKALQKTINKYKVKDAFARAMSHLVSIIEDPTKYCKMNLYIQYKDTKISYYQENTFSNFILTELGSSLVK